LHNHGGASSHEDHHPLQHQTDATVRPAAAAATSILRSITIVKTGAAMYTRARVKAVCEYLADNAMMPLLSEEQQQQLEQPDDETGILWLMQLGQSLRALGNHDMAARYFHACFLGARASILRDWAMYELIHAYVQTNNQPGIMAAVELYMDAGYEATPWPLWMASVAQFYARAYNKSVELATKASLLGCFEGTCDLPHHLQHLPYSLPSQALAWWEGPYDVLRHAYQNLNMSSEAEAAALQYAAAAAKKGHLKAPMVAGLQSAALLSFSRGEEVRL
jgi:hypothetical protein